MSVSPPPGGSSMLWIDVGGAPGVITRNVWPPSTEPSQALRCVPVPVGPLTNTRPCGSTPIVGSPNVWIGSTTDGVSKPIGPPGFGVAAGTTRRTATATNSPSGATRAISGGRNPRQADFETSAQPNTRCEVERELD